MNKIHEKILERKYKQRGRTKSIYREGGFWNGWGQLKVNQQEQFIEMFKNDLDVTIDRFRRIRKYGSKLKTQITAIERIFETFGITKNIWDNESNKN